MREHLILSIIIFILTLLLNYKSYEKYAGGIQSYAVPTLN